MGGTNIIGSCLGISQGIQCIIIEIVRIYCSLLSQSVFLSTVCLSSLFLSIKLNMVVETNNYSNHIRFFLLPDPGVRQRRIDEAKESGEGDPQFRKQ